MCGHCNCDGIQGVTDLVTLLEWYCDGMTDTEIDITEAIEKSAMNPCSSTSDNRCRNELYLYMTGNTTNTKLTLASDCLKA
jgi:hypothetical protein